MSGELGFLVNGTRSLLAMEAGISPRGSLCDVATRPRRGCEGGRLRVTSAIRLRPDIVSA